MKISNPRLWLLVGAILLLGYHIFILPYSPLPWFDETYFASMALHWGRTGEFLPEVGPLLEFYYPQAKAYGPGYFIVLNSVFSLFGFGILQMRIPGLLFGFLFVLVSDRILRLSGLSRLSRFLFVLLLSFDPIFLQNIHSGRMDSMAMFLAAVGIYFLIKGFKNSELILFCFSGLCFGLAILTTPRIAVPLMGPAISLLFYIYRSGLKKGFWNLFTVGFLVFGLYSIWVYWGFGGPVQMWDYFFGQPKEALYFKSLAEGYLSSRLYIPKFQIPALVLLIGSLLWFIFSGGFSSNWLFWISVLNIMAFYWLVNDTGIYSIMVMPFVYFIVVYIAGLFYERRKFIFLGLIVFLIGFNVLIFSFKNAFLLNSIPSRSASVLSSQVSKLIPAGSRVIGDEVYYYSALSNGCSFQYMDRGADGYRRKEYHENVFDYQYAIVKSPPSDPGQFNWYCKDRNLKVVGKISMPEPVFKFQFIDELLAEMGLAQNAGYEGIVLKR